MNYNDNFCCTQTGVALADASQLKVIVRSGALNYYWPISCDSEMGKENISNMIKCLKRHNIHPFPIFYFSKMFSEVDE